MITPPTLAAVKDRETLFRLLRDELHWPLDPEDTYTYQGPELPEGTAPRVDVSRIVPFTANDPFLILLAEFRTPFRRTEMRTILRAIRKEMRDLGRYPGLSLDDIVFVCAEPAYAGVRFARFQEQESGQPRLSVFGWSRADVESTRTLCEINLPALSLRPNILGESDWKEAKPRWIGAWDVERVTKEFFREYREIFEEVEKQVEGVKGDRRLFTQRLFNRLMFIHFLSRKGWLRFNGSNDYLKALWEGRDTEGSFYLTHLATLFFSALNNPHVSTLMQTNPVVHRRIGDVPYLNGGLFEQAPDECQGENVPDNAFDAIINGLFARWNFTVSESTPLDIEVAVDPEMLGKVFEELVTGRHESGSYYTPRPIVSFMCREALKGYLGGGEAVEKFVDEHDATGLPNPEGVLGKLRTVRVCDPACGSGAYLVGMLHELMDLRRALFASKRVDPVDDYHRKLEIIQNNLYGVDLDEFAVNIARLRLWLSLAVEFQGQTPEPLPNLDFKIECGDSLSAPGPSANDVAGGIDMFREMSLQEYEKLKADYASPYYEGNKPALRQKIETLRQEIAEWTHAGTRVSGFDWRVEFAEVFAPDGKREPGGFDVIVANPPYVRQELIKEIKPVLKAIFPEVYTGTADLYVFFYARALQLLRSGGMLAFISSNKWFKANYGSKLREHIAGTCRVLSITDFGELPVFQNAATFPMIFVAQKGGPGGSPLFTQVKSLDPPYPEVQSLICQLGVELSPESVQGSTWILQGGKSQELVARMDQSGILLERYLGSRIRFGIKTGLNAAFYLDASQRDRIIHLEPQCQEIIVPVIVGDNVRRWRIVPDRQWLILAKAGVDITRYEAVLRHLSAWRTQLEARSDRCENWYELRSCDFYDILQQPKIIYPDIAKEPRFALEADGRYINDTVFMLPGANSFLLGVLNSAAVWKYLQTKAAVLGDASRGGRLRLKRIYLSTVPIPPASDTDRAAIEALVQQCLDAKGEGCEVWEKEIDERVEALYGL